MISSNFFALLVIVGCFGDATSVKCKAGIPTLGNSVTKPNLPDTHCQGPYFEDQCYVMVTVYDPKILDKEAYTYGCILKVHFSIIYKLFG